MIDRNTLIKYLEEHADQWHEVSTIAEALGADVLEVRNLLPQLHIDTMKPPPWQAYLDHSEPAAVDAPEDPAVWHLISSMAPADYNRVLVACLYRAQATIQRSESRHWLQRAQEALTSLQALYRD